MCCYLPTVLYLERYRKYLMVDRVVERACAKYLRDESESSKGFIVAQTHLELPPSP